MGLSDVIGDSLSNFEKYNNKEVYSLGNFTVTGRIVSGFTGFIVIILMLMVTFSSAGNSVMVSGLGGSTAYTADVIVTENSGPSLSGSLNEDESIEFGYILEEIEWDYTQEMRITEIIVSVNWDASGGAGPGRQVTFEVSSDNNTAGESQNDGGGGGDIPITWPINPLPETVSDTADSSDDFVSSFEKGGEWMGGRFTFTQASQGSILLSESVSYTITLTYYTWEFENIREIAEI
jgi:hypothetical protein